MSVDKVRLSPSFTSMASFSLINDLSRFWERGRVGETMQSA